MGNKSNNINNLNNNGLKDQYFSLISQSFSHHKRIINRYLLNIEICFKKNFKNSNNNSNQRLRVSIDWKTYLLNFFNNQAKKGHEFYLDIINEINKEKFGFEDKYLSFMFYLDYENTYISKDKEKSFKKYINEEDFDHYEKELKNRLSRNSTFSTVEPGSKRTKSVIDIPNLQDEEYQTRNSTYERNKLKKQCGYLVKLIKYQIERKTHPINIVISIFEKEISSLIDNLLDSFKSDIDNKDKFKKNIENLSDTIVHSIQKFTTKIYIAVKLFYSKVIHLDCLLEEKDELINIIMGILFNTGNLWQKINEIFKIQYKKDICNFAYKLKAIKNLRPKDIQIDDKFCLDENTDELIRQLTIKNKKSSKNLNSSEDIGIFKILSEKDKKIKKNNKLEKIDKYSSAIQMLKKLSKVRSPYKKMLLIASVSTEITGCVDNYWADYEDIIPNLNYLQVTSDELLKIFIYIVAHARLPELIVHEMIVQKFTFSYTKSSMIGYYNSTLDAAINYIQKNLLDDVKIGITEDFRNSIMGTLEINNKLDMDLDSNDIDVPIEENTKLYADNENDSFDEDYVLMDGGKEIKRNKSNELDKYISNTYNEKNEKKYKTKMLDFFNDNSK